MCSLSSYAKFLIRWPIRNFCIFALLFFYNSCSKEKSQIIVIEEPRPLTMADRQIEGDRELLVHSKYLYDAPTGWSVEKSTSFRILNFSFDGTGEVYLSEARGDVLPNLNRWMQQLGAGALTSLEHLEKVTMLGTEAYMVSVEGSFKGFGMSESKDGYMLVGAIFKQGDTLITVKMTGPKESVSSQRKAFMDFCKSLRISDQ